MFTYLYIQILPFCGEFFGKLVAISNISVGEFVNFLSSSLGFFGLSLPYTNLFTGESSIFIFLNGIPKIVAQIVSPIISIIFAPIPSSVPLWIGMLLSCVEIYFLIAFVSFIKKLF